MTRRGSILLLVLLVWVASSFAYAADVPTTFSSTRYYIFSLGAISIDLTSLVTTTQSAGYSVIQYDGDVPSIYRGTVAADVDVATALSDSKVLVVDSGRFYLRQQGDAYTFTVRANQSGYDLVIDPTQDLNINDTLASVLMDLQTIGILGNEVDLEFSSFAKADLKGPAPPADLLMDSTLYGLTVAEDWFAYTATHGLTQFGLRVEVVAEKVPGGTLGAEFTAYVTEETDSLAKLLLPIDQLIPLAESSSVGYVRPPYQPSVP